MDWCRGGLGERKMSLTTQELAALIQGDATASALFAAGNDTGCAARCSAIAPKVIVSPTLIGELGCIDAFAMAGFVAGGDAFMQKLEALGNAPANTVVLNGVDLAPTIKRIVKWMQPNAPGVDAGSPVLRGTLNALASAGAGGITETEVAVFKAWAERSQSITADEVSAVRALG